MRSSYPNVLDAYPEIPTLEDDHTKSCSAADAIRTQDCLVNRAVTTAGMGSCGSCFVTGKPRSTGLF
jgi:hypothetical protein